MSLDFPRTARLTTADDFDRVMQGGQRHKNNHSQIFVLAMAGPPSRLGLVVSKRCGHAPRRNQWKRLWREAFRLERGAFARPVDMVIRVLPGAALPALEDLRRQLRTINKAP